MNWLKNHVMGLALILEQSRGTDWTKDSRCIQKLSRAWVSGPKYRMCRCETQERKVEVFTACTIDWYIIIKQRYLLQDCMNQHLLTAKKKLYEYPLQLATRGDLTKLKNVKLTSPIMQGRGKETTIFVCWWIADFGNTLYLQHKCLVLLHDLYR